MDVPLDIMEGSWDEISRQADKLNGHRLRVIILPDPKPASSSTKTTALLDVLDAEDAAAGPEEIAQGKLEWEAFAGGINANRASAGASLVYP